MKEFHTLKVIDSKYSIKDKVLGQGSFATTYLAFDNKTGKKIACKMIEKQHLVNKINLSKNKTLTKDFFVHALKNEVRTLKALRHEYIVQFIDFSETQNNIYIFLEYCAGGNLEQYLQQNGHIPERVAAKMMFQLAQGCAHLYDKNTYHRDLKTQNILIAAPGILKLSDFGFAKMVSSEVKQNPTSQTSVGTPFYMSPQLILSEPYTIKCDVWSLGVVFYKMLYNLMPWERTDNVLVLLERMKKPLEFPPAIKVSEWIKQLLRGMLTVDQAKRLSMKQVHESLQLGLIEMDLFASSL